MSDGTWYGDWHSNKTELFTEFVRADLSAPVGYSREQMRDIFCEGAITRGDMAKCDQYLATLTPAASDPEVLVKALERIEVLRVVKAGDGETASAALIVNRIMAVAREALATYHWRRG
jgi:hypothetical protein